MLQIPTFCLDFLNLHISHGGFLEIVKILIENGTPVNGDNPGSAGPSSPLHQACYSGEFEVAKCLIEHGSELEAIDDEGNTPLHVACWCRDLPLVQLLVEKGAQLEARNHHGETPLHVAAGEVAVFEIVQYLINKGAQVEPRNDQDETPLQKVCDRILRLGPEKEEMDLPDWIELVEELVKVSKFIIAKRSSLP